MKGKKGRKKKIINNLIFMFIFVIGLFILSYPLISNYYYKIEANEQISSFDKEKSELKDEDITKRMALARAFNDSLNNVISKDPYEIKRLREGRAEYARMLELQEKMGYIQIPAIDVNIPIYAGTSDSVLQKGVGHLEGTYLPIGGNNTHSVLTAHSGLPQAKLFSDLEKLKIGDKFYIHNIAEVLAYQVDDINIVEPSDFSRLLLVPGHDYVTLLTCTPISINTHRLLVRGHRVPYVAEVEERIIEENKTSFAYKYLFYVACILIVILLLIILSLRKKKKLLEKKKKKLEEISSAFMERKDGQE